LNSAAALLVADLVPDLGAGVKLAHEILDDGRAVATLDALVRVTVAARESGDA
jgi:anthranilate phosphoribosyltransferase